MDLPFPIAGFVFALVCGGGLVSMLCLLPMIPARRGDTSGRWRRALRFTIAAPAAGVAVLREDRGGEKRTQDDGS